jgi:hypothetical protein
MKKFFVIVVVIFTPVLTGCSENDPEPKTTLTINNMSSYNLLNVEYSTNFGDIESGKDTTKEVSPGTRYVFFSFSINDEQVRCRTASVLTCEEGKSNELTVTNTTVVTTIAGDKTDTLRNIVDTITVELNKPQIVVKQSSTVIGHYGEYDFETVLIDKTRETTFSIGNTGKSSLTLEIINDNKISLADNSSGFFAVNLQPLSPVVAPGNSASFTICFNPTTGGNNFAATVQIKTDSLNYSEFVFRVKGSSSKDYQIGDEGLGGGLIFFTEGGQYKECSGELGTYAWDAANTTALNYRGGSFTNWKLPDRGELDLMYRNLHLNGLGEFSGSYWSSMRGISDVRTYYFQNFTNGYQSSTVAEASLKVRTVRTFNIFIN